MRFPSESRKLPYRPYARNLLRRARDRPTGLLDGFERRIDILHRDYH